MRYRAMLMLLSVCLATMAQASGGNPLPEPKPELTPGTSPEAIYNRGLARANAGDFVAAEAAYREALRLNDKLPEAWNGLGHALKKQQRYKEALAAYQKALRLRPDFPLAMQYLGELYVQTGQIDKARDLLRRLRQLDQENAYKLEIAINSGSTNW
jgi:tetratricopeptide (TPR) repeat protein